MVLGEALGDLLAEEFGTAEKMGRIEVGDDKNPHRELRTDFLIPARTHPGGGLGRTPPVRMILKPARIGIIGTGDTESYPG
jgi:hypothetical protein